MRGSTADILDVPYACIDGLINTNYVLVHGYSLAIKALRLIVMNCVFGFCLYMFLSILFVPFVRVPIGIGVD
jgi:hypothetical protein